MQNPETPFVPVWISDGGINFHIAGRLADSRCPPIHGGKINWFGDFQPHVAVDPAIEGKIGFDCGRDIGVIQIVDFDGENITRWTKTRVFGHIQLEAGVTAIVLAEAAAIQPKLRNLVDPFEFQENSLAAQSLIQDEMFSVPADAPEVAGDFIAAVMRIPGVREEDLLPSGVGIGSLRRLKKLRLDVRTEPRVAIKRPQRATSMRLATKQPS